MKIFYQKEVALGVDETLVIPICGGGEGDIVCSELHIDGNTGYSIEAFSGEASWNIDKGVDKGNLELADTGSADCMFYLLGACDKVVITATDDIEENIKVVY